MPAEVSHTKVRRSGRIARELPIQVSGIDIQGRDFTAPARTMLLSRYGAQILLRNELVPEQEISISLLGNAQDWDARVVCLCSKQDDGFAYGIEFLFQDGNFWGITFPVGPAGSRATANGHAKEPAATNGHTKEPARKAKTAPRVPDFDPAQHWQQAKKAQGKNYAVRLKCPHADAHLDEADASHWLVLQSMSEPLKMILETQWDFECPMHGAQREYPLEAREAASEVQFVFEDKGPAKSAKADQETARSKPRNRRENRAQQAVRVWVRGLDTNGNPFRQSAYSIDISRSGACLEGPGLVMLPGTTVEVSRRWRKALFKVIWIGRRGTTQASQIGIQCLEPSKNIWGISETN